MPCPGAGEAAAPAGHAQRRTEEHGGGGARFLSLWQELLAAVLTIFRRTNCGHFFPEPSSLCQTRITKENEKKMWLPMAAAAPAELVQDTQTQTAARRGRRRFCRKKRNALRRSLAAEQKNPSKLPKFFLQPTTKFSRSLVFSLFLFSALL